MRGHRFFVLPALLLLFLVTSSGQGVITTVAGTDWLFPGDGQPAANAPLSASSGPDLAIDPDGNVYLCDFGNAMVLRISRDGTIRVVAGNGLVSGSGDGGPAINASLYTPVALALDREGSLYILDSVGTLRKVTPDGIIRTISGEVGESGFSGDGGLAINARFNNPSALAIGPDGSIYISDSDNQRIRKIGPDGMIRTIAGTGKFGYSGDGGPATSADLIGPGRIAVDNRGNVYFADAASEGDTVIGVVRRIDANGIITRVAGAGNRTGDNIPAVQSSLIALAVAADAAGNLYIADRTTAAIRKVDSSGVVTTIAGSGVAGFSGDGGRALSARLSLGSAPSIAIHPDGSIYFADEGNGRIRRIDSAQNISTVAGNGLFRFSGNGGPATSATLYLPTGLAQDAAGNLYVSEATAGRIRKITRDGVITLFAGNGTSGYAGDGGPAVNASLNVPQGLAVAPDGSLIVADSGNCVLRRINTDGIISTVAGTGLCGFAGDGGPATRALLNNPGGVVVDPVGDIAFTESEGNRIRLVSGGSIITVTGDGTAGYSGDGGSTFNARVSAPAGIRLFGNYIYFADSGNNVVRRISLSDLRMETVVGNGKAGFSGDDGPASRASLDTPYGIDFDSNGNLYVADGGNARIRRVTPNGIITTIAGGGLFLFDGVPSTLSVVTPFDVLIDQTAGNLLFSDLYFNRIRAILGTVPSFRAGPEKLALSAPAGGQATDQIVTLTGSIPGVIYAASTDAPWLKITPEAAAMPSNMTVSASAAGLPAGTYNGTISLSAIAEPFNQTIPVTFTVTPPGSPSLGISPSTMQFSFVTGAANSKIRPMAIVNAGGGSMPYTVQISGGGSWLALSSNSGTVGPFGSNPLNITAKADGLAAGTYSATIIVSSAELSQSIVVPVTMTVSAVQQTIQIPQSGLSFVATRGNGAGSVLPQFFSILNTGQGQMRWSVSPTTLSGGFWLGAFPATGVTDANQPLVPQIRVDIDPSGLNAGIYYGTIEVAAAEADNSPQFVSVVLTVVEPDGGVGPIVQPAGLTFVGLAGDEAPGSQTIQVQNTSGAPVTFTTGGVVVNQQPLFEILPSGGTVNPGQPLRIVLQPRTSGLPAGVYRGAITLSFSDGSRRIVAVALVLAPSAGSSSSSAEKGKMVSANCQPKTLVPIFTLINDGFSIPAAYPGQVAVKVVDDCANPMVTGGVSVSFSNGDPPVRLTSLKDGTWAGTWTPQRQFPEIVVTAAAAVPELDLKGQVKIKGTLGSGNLTPVISPGGIVNSGDLSSQVLSPGGRMTLSGANLAGGEVLVGGRPAAVMSSNDTEIVAVLPYGVAANTTHQVVVLRESSISTPQPVIVAPASPGIFEVTPKDPVGAGETLTIFCTGLGEVTPDSTTRLPVTVTIGGIDAPVTFSGLAPGIVGTYQVNATVPSGVPAGTAPVVITVGGQSSHPQTRRCVNGRRVAHRSPRPKVSTRANRCTSGANARHQFRIGRSRRSLKRQIR